MMSLRKRKVTAPVKEESDFENEKSEDENDSDWSNNDPKKGGRPRKKISPLSKPVPNETLSEYERIRLANIEERNEMLRSMGINVPTEKQQKAHKTVRKETPKPKKIKKEKENTPTPTRISARLKGKPAVYDSFMDENTTAIEEEPDIDTRNLGRWARGRKIFGERAYEDLKSRTGRSSILPRKYFE